MSLLDKFKNLFTDEEEEIEEEIPIKSNPKKEETNSLPTFMREKIEREKNEKEIHFAHNIENTSDLARQIPKSEPLEKKEVSTSYQEVSPMETKAEVKAEDKNSSFKFPIAFEEKDFIETTRQSKQNVIYKEQEKKKEQEEARKKKTASIYGSKKEKKEEPKFKATPIISPVYGILDKNYTKEEVKVNENESLANVSNVNIESKSPSRTSTPKVDFESVRRKAYGNLTDDIRDNLSCENCELLKEARRMGRINNNDDKDLLEDMTEDLKETSYSKKDISIEEAEENYYDFGVSYEPNHNITEPESIIDSEPIESFKSIEDDTQEVKIVNHLDNETESEPIEFKEPAKSKPSVLSTLKKSMGEVPEKPEFPTASEQPKKKSIEDLELTDDLFNLIDSMYEERNDD